jgi:hypothetical protein
VALGIVPWLESVVVPAERKGFVQGGEKSPHSFWLNLVLKVLHS